MDLVPLKSLLQDNKMLRWISVWILYFHKGNQ